jgi:hypothetical protein
LEKIQESLTSNEVHRLIKSSHYSTSPQLQDYLPQEDATIYKITKEGKSNPLDIVPTKKLILNQNPDPQISKPKYLKEYYPTKPSKLEVSNAANNTRSKSKNS